MTSDPIASLTTGAASPVSTPDAVPVAAPKYRRLVRQWWRWKFDEAWLAADHVLIVRTRFFSERYLRLYWADIAALLFFPAAQNRGIALIGEIICLVAGPALILLGGPAGGRTFFTASRVAGLSIAGTSIVLYSVWRFTRRRWNVEVLTLTGRAVVPLAIRRPRSERYVDLLRQNVESAQPPVEAPVELLTEQSTIQIDAAGQPPPTAFLGAVTPEKRPIVALHAAVFLLGIVTSALSYLTAGSPWYPLFIFSAVLFYLGLPVLFFLQQGPEFPFAVRCAAVLNMSIGAAALLGVSTGYTLFRLAAFGFAGPRMDNLVNVLRLICCLFGIMSLWKYRIDREASPTPPQRTLLS